MAYLHLSPSFAVLGLKNGITVYSRKTGAQTVYQHQFKDDAQCQEIDCACFSPAYDYYAALFSDKTLHIWFIPASGDVWEDVGVMEVKRRSTTLSFSPDGDVIYVADKSGDLYSFPLKNDEVSSDKEDDPVLGHVSILLDVAITNDYVITADRDEKIRISDRKHPYVINTFCLGHKDFVCKVLPISQSMLLSGSGDGTMCTWNMKDGALLRSYKVGEVALGNHDNNGTCDVKAKCSIPGLIAHSSDVNMLAVACFGASDVIKIFLVTQDEYLKEVYSIPFESSYHVVDVAFDPILAQSSTLLYVHFLNDSVSSLKCYQCKPSSCCEVELDDTMKSLDSFLSTAEIKVSRNEYYKNLYKTTVPGHVYDAFYSKKKNQFKKQKTQAKKRKVTS